MFFHDEKKVECKKCGYIAYGSIVECPKCSASIGQPKIQGKSPPPTEPSKDTAVDKTNLASNLHEKHRELTRKEKIVAKFLGIKFPKEMYIELNEKINPEEKKMTAEDLLF